MRRQRAPVRIRTQHGRERIADVLALERAPAGQHLVKHAAKRPDVAPFVGLASFGLLGAHVRGGTEDDADPGHHGGRGDRRCRGEVRYVVSGFSRTREFGQAEVEHFHLSIL